MTELAMDTRIVWDPLRLKEIDEAKKVFLSYKRQGYEIVTSDGSKLDKFAPSLGEVIVRANKIIGQCVLKILSDKGDDRISWNKNRGQEAKEAKKKFDELVTKGYKIYSVTEDGKKKMRVSEFDVDAEELIAIPPTTKA